MTKTLDLKGVIPPMITPLTSAGDIDTGSVQKLVQYMLAQGVSGVFIMGSSGEGPWLDMAQREQLISSTVQAVAGRVPVLVGVLEPGTRRTLEVLRQVEHLGVDAVVIASPYYFGVDSAAQLKHFETVARESTLPVILYNIPPTTHNPISAETVRQALAFDNIIAIKDSAGNWDDFVALLALRDQYPDFRVFQGAEKIAAQSILAGADGLVPGLGNLVPHIFRDITESASDQSRALQLQATVDTLGTLHSHAYWLPCLKYAASLLGFGSGTCINRDAGLDGAGQEAIRQLVEKIVPEMMQ